MSEGFQNLTLTCSFCGQALSADAEFCPECGTPVDSKGTAAPSADGVPNVPAPPQAPSQPATMSRPASDPVAIPAPAPRPGYAAPQQGYAVPQPGYAAPQAGYATQPVLQVAAPEPKKNHTVLIVVLTVIITFAVIMVWGAYVSSSDGSSQSSSQQPQTQNPQSDGGSSSEGSSDEGTDALASPTTVQEGAQYLLNLGYTANQSTGPAYLKKINPTLDVGDKWGISFTDDSGNDVYQYEMTCSSTNALLQYETSGSGKGWRIFNADGTGGDGKVYASIAQCGQR